jgi:hypothetical protein
MMVTMVLKDFPAYCVSACIPGFGFCLARCSRVGCRFGSANSSDREGQGENDMRFGAGHTCSRGLV